MADIRLTEGADTVNQPESAKTGEWNNYYALGGNDVVKLYQGTVLGGAGDDRIERIPSDWWRSVQAAYWDSPKGVRVDLVAGTAEDGWGGHDTLVGVNDSSGSGNDDVFIGNAEANHFWPGNGNDTVDGAAGIDVVSVPWFEPTPGQPWRQALWSDLDIQVSVDGLSATIRPKTGKGFVYTLKNVELLEAQVTGNNDWLRLDLASFISPQDQAQAVMAGGGLRWNAAQPMGTPTTLSYSFVQQAPAGGVGATGFRAFTAAEQQLVREILAKTAAITGLTFTEVAETGASTGQLRFGVSQQSATKGTAFLPNQAGAGDQAGDVWMDVESMVGLQPGSEGYAALLHEIGHALGLRHPRNVDAGDSWTLQLRAQDDSSAASVMSGVPSADGLWRGDWGALDVLALRALYGTRGSNAGDTVYPLGSTAANLQSTITDDGGTDTLDASASPVGISLDLAPGHYSSYGLSTVGVAGVNNLGITATSWIENASGSAFDDVLLGNDLDNRLTGGLGNDWLDGGKGTDTAVFAGARADYELANSYGKLYVRARDGSSGYDTLLNIEKLQFADQVVLLSASVLGSDARYTLDEDSALSTALPAPGDVDAATARYTLALPALHGTASITAQGTLSYQPAADFYGSDQVTYDITAGGKSNRYIAFVQVAPINDGPPVAQDGGALAIAGTRLGGRLPVASDIDRDPVAYTLTAEPQHGVVAVGTNGTFSYTPAAGYSGQDSFRYTVSDGMGGGNSYTERLWVATTAGTRSGTDAADELGAGAAGEGYLLQGGNDRATGGGGNDVFDGGDGIDTAVYSGRRADYALTNGGTHWVVADSKGSDGTDLLGAMERLQFADRSVALDLDGHAGTTAQILRALFGPSALKSAEFAGYGILYTDAGMSYADLVKLAIGTDAFLALAHSRSNSDFVKLVYQNVVGSAPSASDLASFTALLDNGTYTQTSLGVMASQIGINANSIELAGLASTGLDYILPG